MKALILAAGLGTRLMPLTAATPKALVKVNGTTLLEIAIRNCAAQGFNELIVNVHHHSDQIRDYLSSHSFPGTSINISDESDLLLDTGGAILKAKPFLDGYEPFLVHNVDVISNTNLHQLYLHHINNQCLATLSVLDRNTKRYFLFDNNLRLTGWTDTSTGETRLSGTPAEYATKLAFSGIHIISPEIFKYINDHGRFSIIDTYLKIGANHLICGYLQPGVTWFDLGKPEQIEAVSSFLQNQPEFFIKR